MYNNNQGFGGHTFQDDREKVELYFSARKLTNKDTFSKTDPIFFIYYKTGERGTYNLIHKTEQIQDNLNPDFTKSLTVDFIFETHQFFKIECRDIDNTSGSDYDELGTCEFELGNLMGCRNNMLILNLIDSKFFYLNFFYRKRKRLWKSCYKK